MSLGDLLGLTLQGYIKMGCEEVMKHGKCILCGAKPMLAGVCVADGTPAARERIGTPDAAKNPHSHRLVFWAVCEHCKDDPARDQKVTARILESVKKYGTTPPANTKPVDPRPTPLADGQTFSL